MGQIGLMHHLASSFHGALFPWVLSRWNAAFLTALLASLGDFLFISGWKQQGLPVSFKTWLSSPSRWPGVCWAAAESCGNAFHAGRAPALASGVWVLLCSGFGGAQSTVLAFGVPKVQFLGTEQSLQQPGLWSQALPAFHHEGPGKEVPILCCLTFPEKTSVFQS